MKPEKNTICLHILLYTSIVIKPLQTTPTTPTTPPKKNKRNKRKKRKKKELSSPFPICPSISCTLLLYSVLPNLTSLFTIYKLHFSIRRPLATHSNSIHSIRTGLYRIRLYLPSYFNLLSLRSCLDTKSNSCHSRPSPNGADLLIGHQNSFISTRRLGRQDIRDGSNQRNIPPLVRLCFLLKTIIATRVSNQYKEQLAQSAASFGS